MEVVSLPNDVITSESLVFLQYFEVGHGRCLSCATSSQQVPAQKYWYFSETQFLSLHLRICWILKENFYLVMPLWKQERQPINSKSWIISFLSKTLIGRKVSSLWAQMTNLWHCVLHLMLLREWRVQLQTALWLILSMWISIVIIASASETKMCFSYSCEISTSQSGSWGSLG